MARPSIRGGVPYGHTVETARVVGGQGKAFHMNGVFFRPFPQLLRYAPHSKAEQFPDPLAVTQFARQFHEGRCTAPRGINAVQFLQADEILFVALHDHCNGAARFNRVKTCPIA